MNNGKMKSAAKKAGAGAMGGMAGKASKGMGDAKKMAMGAAKGMGDAKKKMAMSKDRKPSAKFMGGGMVKGGYK
jgi:hypothetical protein